jgi:hypothetical protein
MKDRVLAKAGTIAGVALVAIAFVNLWQANRSLSYLKPRSEDAVVVWEDRLRFVRNTLMKAGYWRGDVGYISGGVLLGRPRTQEEDGDWGQARYVMIPWNLLQDSLAPPFVIADFSRTKESPTWPEGFVKLYDSGDGLIVLARPAVQ